MPLDKQNINISFSQGIETKTDPNQVLPGQLLELENCVFTEGLAFNKRNGYTQLTAASSAASSGFGLAVLKEELLVFDNTVIKSYRTDQRELITKGLLTSIDLTTSSVVKDQFTHAQQDSAYSSLHNSYCFVYETIQNAAAPVSLGFNVSVVDADTGNTISSFRLGGTYVKPRVFSLGHRFIITVVDITTSPDTLTYYAFDNTTREVLGPNAVSDTVKETNQFYDGSIVDNHLILSWNASDGGGAIKTISIALDLTLSATMTMSAENADGGLTQFVDPSTNFVWITYYNGSAIRYIIKNPTTLTNVLDATNISTIANVTNLSGYAVNSSGILYYEISNNYSYSFSGASVASDFVNKVSITQAGSVGTPALFIRGVGLISRTIVFNGFSYFVAVYSGGQGFEPTYFIVRDAPGFEIVGRLAFTNAGGYAASVTSFNSISNGVFQFAYLSKSLIQTQAQPINTTTQLIYSQIGIIPAYTQTGVNSAIVDFNNINSFQGVPLGNALNISGGFLWNYDGTTPTENNFHLFPEDMVSSAIAQVAGTSGVLANNYAYVATYEWTDANGYIWRSAPSVPTQITIAPNTTATISVNIPNLRVTNKPSVNIGLYRNAPSVSVGTFYQVYTAPEYTFSSTASDFTNIKDSKRDEQIVGNPFIYTTGGVLENTGAPATKAITVFKNRVFTIDAENPDVLWYSKEVIQNVPIEFSDLQTIFVTPRYGSMKAMAEMDDKLVLFKANAIYYQTGNGPDNTGANNDFSEPIFITSIVGCSNQKSIVLIQDGLMFQSNKGIWLLDRGLNISYIGAQVEKYNSYAVTSAIVIPQTTQIRFTLQNGLFLVYDYYYKQWGTFPLLNAVGSVLFNELHTFLQPGGLAKLFQETPGLYQDGGNPVLMSLTSGWVSMAGFQGFQRAYRLYFIGKYLSPHVLTVSVAYDYDQDISQSAAFIPLSVDNDAYGDAPFYGADKVYGGYTELEQVRVNFTRQKCQSVLIKIQENLFSGQYGAGLKLEAIGLVVSGKKTYPKLPAIQSIK